MTNPMKPPSLEAAELAEKLRPMLGFNADDLDTQIMPIIKAALTSARDAGEQAVREAAARLVASRETAPHSACRNAIGIGPGITMPSYMIGHQTTCLIQIADDIRSLKTEKVGGTE